MPQRNDLTETIAITSQLLPVVEANQEIAVMRIAQVRNKVLATRAFEEGLSSIYSSVVSSNQQMLAKTKRAQFKKKESAAILLATNERLTGNITAKTADQFIDFTASHAASDVIIIGQVGREMWQHRRVGSPFFFFDLPEQSVSMHQIQPLLQQLLQYQELTVFYPRYTSVVTQAPTIRSLGSVIESTTQVSAARQPEFTQYLFEPSLKKVVKFFNDQIFSIVIKQLFEEAELATLGSRITAMENSAFNIRNSLDTLIHLEQQHKRRVNNNRQRERLAGMQLWHTSK